jgi:hypothetical protein
MDREVSFGTTCPFEVTSKAASAGDLYETTLRWLDTLVAIK